jgi:preprotein translocase subunit YajC
MYATVTAVDGDDVVLEVAPGVEVRYVRRAIMEVITPGDQPETDDAEPESYADTEEPDAEEPEADGTREHAGTVGSAEEGLADSHDDLARSDKGKVS